jgi:branched-subunit amino acid aminotransferase/4-amino-4-deoxychorismate lyase
MSIDRIELNGRVPDIAELGFLAQVNYGHFTTMQVRDRCARGFSLHLQRLQSATRELFGAELDVGRVRDWVRQALGDGVATLRITVFSLALDRRHLELPVPVDVLISVNKARSPRTAPLRIQSVRHERALPGIKHVGTFDLYHHWRQARLAGFDDVVFTSVAGEISEGSIWNIGFWDGVRVIWPNAPALPGITMQLLDAGLRDQGIETEVRPVFLAQLDQLRGAFILNSGSVGPMIECIDSRHFEVDSGLMQTLQSAYESRPLERI